MTPPRSDYAWLAGTYWYCPAPCMPALRTLPGNRFERVVDQTVWAIAGYADGYFWGVASALVTPAGSTPDPSAKNDMTLFASVTPQGQVHITFVHGDGSATIGTGVVTTDGEPRFEMQMSSGAGPVLVVHWAYMQRIERDDPQWHRLPGAGVSVDAMVGDIAVPTAAGSPNR